MNVLRTIWQILSPRQKTAGGGLVVLMVASMMLEMVGLGMVVPALGLMASDSSPNLPPLLVSGLSRLGSPSRPTLVMLGLAALFLLSAVKAGFLLFSIWRQNRFVRDLSDDISARLITVYLSQPWTFHLQRNSATLIRNIQSVATFSYLLTTVLGLLAECLILLGILGVLVWFEPVGALTVGSLLGAAGLLLERLTRGRLIRWGTEAHHNLGLAQQHLQQGFGAAKEIKVLGCERFFVDSYVRHSRIGNALTSRQQFVNQVPRLWYELLAVTALCVLTLVMTSEGKSTREMIPTLGLFAVAAFRLLPSVNKLSIGAQAVRYSTATFSEIARELKLADVAPATPLEGSAFSFRRAVSLDDITFRYPSASSPSLLGVSLEIPHGGAVGIIGGSGAGKSTLVDVVLGLIEPDEGRVLVDGRDIASDIRGWQRLVGYVPQSIYLSDDTIRQNVAFGVPPQEVDEVAVSRALRSAQLDEFVRGLPEGADTLIGERGVRLSGGQRQRIGIARALYHDPQLLVLDEATSSLDTATEREVMRAIEGLHGTKTLLIVAHRLSTLSDCDLIYELDKGRLLRSGAYAEVVGT